MSTSIENGHGRKEEHATVPPPTSTNQERKAPKDPYYGHEDTAKMAARFIISLFNCPIIPPATGPDSPQPSLAHFIAYSLHRTRLPHFVTLVGLILMQRLKARYPSARGSSGHRLFISAFMIASKVVCDDTYSNKSWCIVAQQMFTLKEMNQMEREMCGYLEWNLNASTTEIDAFEAKLKAEHSTMAYNARKAQAKAQQHAQLLAKQHAHQQQQQHAIHMQSSNGQSSNGTCHSGHFEPSGRRVTAGLPSRSHSQKTSWSGLKPTTMSSLSGRSSPQQCMQPSYPSSSYQNGYESHNYYPTANGGPSSGTSRMHIQEIPAFHPGSNGPVMSNSPATSRRGSKASLANAKLSTGSRSNSAWNLAQMGSNGDAQAVFRSGEYARSSSGAGLSSRSSIKGRRMGTDDEVDAYEDDESEVDRYRRRGTFGTAISPGQAMRALSTTWPRTAMEPRCNPSSTVDHLQSDSRPDSRSFPSSDESATIASSPSTMTSHLHNSPHPSLTNDSSNQSSPDSQLCQTPSPLPTSQDENGGKITLDTGLKQKVLPIQIQQPTRSSPGWW